LVPGEIVNSSVVRYLKFARAFNEKFPGFETDVHGLVKENGVYALDCVNVKPSRSKRAFVARSRKQRSKTTEIV
jgi:hypothetical protein